MAATIKLLYNPRVNIVFTHILTKEPNIQSTERDPKQNVMAACNEFALYFQVLLFNVFQFQLNRNVFHRHNDEFFIRNLESRVD